jgi:hypothetical protein
VKGPPQAHVLCTITMWAVMNLLRPVGSEIINALSLNRFLMWWHDWKIVKIIMWGPIWRKNVTVSMHKSHVFCPLSFGLSSLHPWCHETSHFALPHPLWCSVSWPRHNGSIQPWMKAAKTMSFYIVSLNYLSQWWKMTNKDMSWHHTIKLSKMEKIVLKMETSWNLNCLNTDCMDKFTFLL